MQNSVEMTLFTKTFNYLSILPFLHLSDVNLQSSDYTCTKDRAVSLGTQYFKSMQSF